MHTNDRRACGQRGAREKVGFTFCYHECGGTKAPAQHGHGGGIGEHQAFGAMPAWRYAFRCYGAVVSPARRLNLFDFPGPQ
jgi:hypothetical protein